MHPQFTEPDVALAQRRPRPRPRRPAHEDDFRLDPTQRARRRRPRGHRQPDQPHRRTPPGRRDPTASREPGRLVVVDEAFLDDDVESLADERHAGLVVLRSLTKLWSIPGHPRGLRPRRARRRRRAAGPPDRRGRSPRRPSPRSSLHQHRRGRGGGRRRAPHELDQWRAHLAGTGSTSWASRHVAEHRAVRPRPHRRRRAGKPCAQAGFAVRRATRSPGSTDEWVRIAVRPPRGRHRPTSLRALRCRSHPVLRKPVGIRQQWRYCDIARPPRAAEVRPDGLEVTPHQPGTLSSRRRQHMAHAISSPTSSHRGSAVRPRHPAARARAVASSSACSSRCPCWC